MPIALSSIVIVAGAAAVAAVVKGTLGLGFPPVTIALIGTALGPQTAVTATAIPAFLMNVAQAWQGRSKLIDCGPLVPLFLALVPGAFIGAYFLTILPGHIAASLVGLTVMVYAILSLFQVAPVIPPRFMRSVGALSGFCAGVVGGATGIHGPILALYLSALRLDKETFPAMLSLSLFIGQLPQIIGYAGLGLLTTETLTLSAAMLPSAAIGFLVGTYVRNCLSQESFSIAVRIALVIIGANLVREGLGLRFY